MNTEILHSATVKRLLVERFGLTLTRFDLIHHIDHNRRNNGIHNLVRLTGEEHGLAHRGAIRAPKTPVAFMKWLRDLRTNPWKYRRWISTQIKAVNSYAGTPCTECKQPFQINEWYTSQHKNHWHSECFRKLGQG